MRQEDYVENRSKKIRLSRLTTKPDHKSETQLRSWNSIIMYFPKLLSCIKRGHESVANGSKRRLSKPYTTGSSRRSTNESTRSLRRRKISTSLKFEESDSDQDKDKDKDRSSPSRSPALPPSTAEDLHAVFRKFDANGDGKISWSELGMLMASLGCPASDDELRLMVSMADSDGDGFIDFSEFAELNTFGVDEPRRLQDMKTAFGIFDFDGNGLISPEELLRVFHKLGERSSLEDCRIMIASVDSNGDGYVSFDEFLIMMTATASASTSKSSS